MKKYKNKKTCLRRFILPILGFFIFFAYLHNSSAAVTVEELNKNIQNKKGDVETLKERVETYEEKIAETRAESLSLRNHIAVLENEIAKNEVEIEISRKLIESTNLEIQKANLEINETREKIDKQKGQMAELIRIIYQNDQVPDLQILLLNDTFSEFFDHYKYIFEIQENLQQSLEKFKKIKEELEIQKNGLEGKKKQEQKLKEDLENQKKNLLEKQNGKEKLLVQTQQSENKFKSYVTQLKAEQRQINAEIVTLEKKLRDEIEARKQSERFKGFGKPRLGWPTNGRYITARFHDPDYPYRYIFEHPAIDIRTTMGSLVLAAEDGFVGKVKFDGSGNYAYVMIIHNDGLSTVYGHISNVLVSPDRFVNKGDVIALSGGIPGSPGAGNLTTGAHLHFEVRLNGIPVDPLGTDKRGEYYLPRDWL